MKQKLFTLMTLLVLCVTGAWGSTVTYNFGGASDAVAGDLSAWTVSLSTDSEAGVILGSATASSKTIKKGSSNYSGAIFELKNYESGGSSSLTTKTSYNLISNISFNITCSDNGKSNLTVQVSPDADFSVPANIVTILNNEPLKTGDNLTNKVTSNGTFASQSFDLATAKTGYVRFIFTNNSGSANKYYELDDVVITYTAATYKVTYKANGSGESDVVDNEASTVGANPFTYAGHAFTGWNTEDDGTGTDYAVGASVTADLTLYAQWDTSYDITKGTHTNGDFTITPASAAAGTEITLAATPSSGYDFASWTILKTSDDSDVTDAVSLSSTTAATATFTLPAYGVTVNATFEAAKYTVTYDVNGGGSCATTSEKQASAGAAVTLPTPTWAGYTFNGWYNAGTKIGDAGDSYTPTANITLYAKWTDNIEGKLFSYVDGNYGDKFQAFDASGWVTADATNKSKTFTDGTTGAQFIITTGAWDSKSNSISALAKFKAGSTTMKVVVPTGYKATVKIWYNSYGESKLLKIDDVNQTAPGSNKLNDGHTNAQIEAKLVAVEVTGKSGDVILTSSGSSDNIYIARVAVVLTHVTGTITASGWNTFSSSHALDLSNVTNGTAYVASAAEGTTVTLTPVDDKIVAAGTGLMIKGTADDVFAIGMTAEAATFSGTNKLGGLPTGGTVARDNHNYVFGWSDPADPGFYLVNATEPNLAAGKAYLHADNDLTVGARLSLDFGEGGTTAISEIEKMRNGGNETFFDLQGRKVAQPAKGLYIVNGRKVIVK